MIGAILKTCSISPPTICGGTLDRSAHVCAFFDSEQQSYDCIAAFITEGIRSHEHVVSVVDADKRTAHLASLARHGVPVARAARSHLRVLASEETCIEGGRFEVQRMLRCVEGMLEQGRRAGFGRVRSCTDMSWALRELPGTSALMEYEARLNMLTEDHDCTLLCTYDVNRFSARMVMEALAAHPYVVIGDTLYRNPCYVPRLPFLNATTRDAARAGPGVAR